jgi:hypothetical protein
MKIFFLIQFESSKMFLFVLEQIFRSVGAARLEYTNPYTTLCLSCQQGHVRQNINYAHALYTSYHILNHIAD